jgi:hypothetical protein
VQLELSYRVDRGSESLGKSGSTDASGQLNDPGKLEGGLHLSMPEIGTMRSLRQRRTAQPNTLFVRAQLVQSAPRRVLWVQIVQCTITPTAREDQLAHDLGQLVGASLGKTVAPQRF